MNRREVAAPAAVAGCGILLAATLSLLDPAVSRAMATAAPAFVLLTVVAAAALLSGAFAAALRPPAGALAPLLAALAVIWIAPLWVGWTDGPPLLRSIGALLTPLAAPVLLHVILAAPRGRLRERGPRALVAAAYAVFVGISIAISLVRDPFLDRHCWSNCSENVFLVVPLPRLAAALGTAVLFGTIAVAAAGAAVAAARLARTSRPWRPELARIVVPAGLALLAEATRAGILLLDPAEGPGNAMVDVHRPLFAARAAALALLGIGVAWTVLAVRARRRRVAQLAQELGAPHAVGTLQTALAAILGDPTLEVLYSLPGSLGHVDARGERRDPARGPERAATEIRRGDDVIAVVVHDAALRDDPRLADYLGAAARLAIDNERLQAGILAQLRELRESRARVIESADAARRMIERNLHDGAQQTLVALLYELSLARLEAAKADDPGRATIFTTAYGRVAAVAERLRSIAHGPFPPILDDVGLEPALRRLTEESPVPMELALGLSGRLPRPVERAAYVVVSNAVAAAGRAAASIEASVTLDHELLTVRVDGAAPDDLETLRDRVGALGGAVDDMGGGVRAVIPCG